MRGLLRSLCLLVIVQRMYRVGFLCRFAQKVARASSEEKAVAFAKNVSMMAFDKIKKSKKKLWDRCYFGDCLNEPYAVWYEVVLALHQEDQ